jgi:lysozyme family protein
MKRLEPLSPLVAPNDAQFVSWKELQLLTVHIPGGILTGLAALASQVSPLTVNRLALNDVSTTVVAGAVPVDRLRI